MNCDKKDLLLYAVTDRAWLGDKTLSWQVEESLKGGATMIQLREKHLDHEHFLKEAKEIKELCRKYQVPFLINDDVDLAVEVDADGVHVGQHDMEAREVRKKIGPNRILGVSAQTVEQALLAQQAGADYLGVGAVFPTGTKDDADAVSIQTLGEICHAVSIPVVAIGGIGQHNVMQLAGSGICGIAVVSAIYAQPDIQNAASTLHALAKVMVARSKSQGLSLTWTEPWSIP